MMETVSGKIDEKPITLNIMPKGGDPPFPASYYRFNRSTYDSMIPPQAGTISTSDMMSRNYFGGSSYSHFRRMSGHSSGPIYASNFRNSIIFKVYKEEFYKDHRSSTIVNVAGTEIDYSMMQRGGGPLHNMSTAIVSALKSQGFNYIQDMGTDGNLLGAVRSIDSANVKNGDWQWWDFCTRYGWYYIRVYK